MKPSHFNAKTRFQGNVVVKMRGTRVVVLVRQVVLLRDGNSFGRVWFNHSLLCSQIPVFYRLLN